MTCSLSVLHREQRREKVNTSMIDVHNGQVSVVLACDVRP